MAGNEGGQGNELDSQLRAKGVNKEQRKRLIAAARLGGIPNPLKQLGLRDEGAERRSRSRSPRRAALWQQALEAPPPPAQPGAPLPLAIVPGVASGSGQRPAPRAAAARPPPPRGPSKEEDDPDLDSFLAGGRAIMAKAKAMGQARREQAQRGAEQQEQQEQQKRREREQAEEEARRRQEEQRRREAEERERREEEERREALRRQRREEKLRRKEQKRRQRQEDQLNQEEDCEEDDDSPAEAPNEEDEERRRRLTAAEPAKGFFSQAFKGNQQQRALWSQPIKGHVSNNYRGTSDADLERRFRLAQGAQAAGEKLMTEEEVLAMLKSRKTKGR